MVKKEFACLEQIKYWRNNKFSIANFGWFYDQKNFEIGLIDHNWFSFELSNEQ